MRNCIRWSRVEPKLPPGLHYPKLDGDVGWDLEAMEQVTIGPMQSADVPVNANLALPKGVYADIRNRSSMARRGLYVDQNIIDTGYRGPLFVFIRNMHLPQLYQPHPSGRTRYTKEPGITIRAGERIAQLIFHHVHPMWLAEIDEVSLETGRGAAGFGSTGR